MKRYDMIYPTDGRGEGKIGEDKTGQYLHYEDVKTSIYRAFVKGAVWMGDRQKGGMSNADYRSAEVEAMRLKWMEE